MKKRLINCVSGCRCFSEAWNSFCCVLLAARSVHYHCRSSFFALNEYLFVQCLSGFLPVLCQCPNFADDLTICVILQWDPLTHTRAGGHCSRLGSYLDCISVLCTIKKSTKLEAQTLLGHARPLRCPRCAHYWFDVHKIVHIAFCVLAGSSSDGAAVDWEWSGTVDFVSHITNGNARTQNGRGLSDYVESFTDYWRMFSFESKYHFVIYLT